MVYFQRMLAIETKFCRAWFESNLNDSLTELERSKLTVWDFPMTTKYDRMWQAIQETGMANTIPEGVERVRKSTLDDGFAFLDDGSDFRYYELTSCDLKTVGTDFARKAAAMGLQEGSPLKQPLDDA